MGWLDKTRGKLSEAKDKLAAIEVNDTLDSAKAASGALAGKASSVFASSKEKAAVMYQSGAERAREFDYSSLKSVEFYRERFAYYGDLGSKKIAESFRATFEVDKTTAEIVEGIRCGLPVPAQTVDDIFEQVRREAVRRAVAGFFLSGTVYDLDNRSQEKYQNLSESYTEFKDRVRNRMTDTPEHAKMVNEREDARKKWGTLEDGYNKDVPLDPFSADIEHVIAKKEMYDNTLIRMSTSEDEFFDLLNASDNLVFAESSFNSSLQDRNIFAYLDKRGRQDPERPDILLIDIVQKDGIVKTVEINKNDVEEAYALANDNYAKGKIGAVVEIGATVVKSGATMAVQQVVGLIVMESVDIFVEEIKDFAKNGQLFNENGWVQNTKNATDRVHQRLAERFEQRQVWARAKSLGIESGVAGALSVIPQIVISMIVKMPAFVLALIREATLSTVRCVRILMSKTDENKLDSIKLILAGTAAAVVGVYAGRVIGGALSGVPLLNSFNSQITDVLTGVLITAVPLAAIYAFEQNKHRLAFSLKR